MKKINFRNFNQYNFAKFAMITSYLLATLMLITFCYNLFTIVYYHNNYDIQTIISNIINICFYIFMANYFNKGKNEFYYLFYGILCLLICNFIIPIILDIIRLNFTYFTFIPLIISSVLSIIYFIFLVLENKKREKKYLKCLIIVGIILAIASLIYGIFSIIILFSMFIPLFGSLTNFNDFLYLFSFAISIIASLIETCLIPIIIGLYPLILKKERLY